MTLRLRAARELRLDEHAGPQLAVAIGEDACTCPLRVASSMTESNAVTLPRLRRAARRRTSPRRRDPTASVPISCCGTLKFTYTGRSDCSETIGAPPARYCPRLIWRSAEDAGERSADGLALDRGADLRRLAPSACLYSAAAASYVACGMIFAASIPCIALEVDRDPTPAAPRPTRAAPAPASRRARRGRRPCSPAGRNRSRSRSTTPGRSALTVTPCTAATVPIAFSVAFHASGFATTVVTASGGGCSSAPSPS